MVTELALNENNYLKYLSVFVIYLIVDVAYQFAFGIQFSRNAQEEAGISQIFAPDIQNPLTLLIWFAIITTAIVKLVVEPAVKAKSIKNGSS